MFYKGPEYNKDKLPLCEICHVGYKFLLKHVNHRHGLNASEYKRKYNYHPRKGIIGESLKKKMRKIALDNYDTAIMNNLIIGGISSRFKEGNTATDKELVSRLGRETMNAYWKGRRVTKEEKISTLIGKLRFL